jgi:flagellar hook-associated protein 1 FlgK
MFEGLQIALTGIRASQASLDTTTNNVANANTPGYTRQRVDLVSLGPWRSVTGEIGMGVDVAAISRMRETHLDSRARAMGASSAYATARSDMLSQTEELLGEPDAGIQQAVLGVFDAFDELALDPSNIALRDNVIAAFDMLAGRMRSVASTWSQLETDARTQIDSALGDANQLLARVDALNRSIAAASGNPSNAALDERDMLLDQLSETLGTTTESQSNGMVHVLLDGERLVNTPTAAVRTVSYDATAGVVVTDTATPVTAGGKVGGLHAFVSTDMPAVRSLLDQLALDLRDAVNTINASGSAPDPGGVSWTDGGPALLVGTGAADFAVASGVTGTDVATAGLGNHALHDATNVARYAALRDQNPPAGAPPLDERLRTMVVNLGNMTADATARASTQQSLRSNAVAARQSGHGVNLDEEMVSLVQHQRALEAAARAMSAIDEALDTLINRTGIVGR